MNNAERNQEARDIHNDVTRDNGRGFSGTCPSYCSASSIDNLRRAMVAAGLSWFDAATAVGLAAEYASSAYMSGYDRGYEAGVNK